MILAQNFLNFLYAIFGVRQKQPYNWCLVMFLPFDENECVFSINEQQKL